MLLYFLFCLLSCEHVEYFSWLGCVGSTAGRAVTLGWPSSMIGVGSLPPALLLGRRTCVRLDAERVHIDKLSVRAANQPVSLCAMLRESQKRKEYNNIYPKEEEKKSINRGRRRPWESDTEQHVTIEKSQPNNNGQEIPPPRAIFFLFQRRRGRKKIKIKSDCCLLPCDGWRPVRLVPPPPLHMGGGAPRKGGGTSGM